MVRCNKISFFVGLCHQNGPLHVFFGESSTMNFLGIKHNSMFFLELYTAQRLYKFNFRKYLVIDSPIILDETTQLLQNLGTLSLYYE